MAFWHLYMGFGIGLIATFLTVIINSRETRRIKHSQESEFLSTPDEVCPVCYVPLSNNEMRYLRCGHAMHENCLKALQRHGQKTCPLCRKPID